MSWISKVWFSKWKRSDIWTFILSQNTRINTFQFVQKVCLWVVKLRKNCTIDSILFPQLHKGSTESGKLCLNLRFFKWLKPILRRVWNFSPDGLFMLKTLLEFSLMKFNKKFLKIAELRISRSRLFHSLTHCY